jgi:hypothetical protein
MSDLEKEMKGTWTVEEILEAEEKLEKLKMNT